MPDTPVAPHTPDDDTPRLHWPMSSSERPTATTTLRGRVFRAGEGACLHLVCVEATYELVGATTGLVVGRRASVTGRVDRTVLSQCGRGVPFVVTNGSPLPTSGG